jgi:tetratricopeptide (TPR) repeat protein
VFLANLAYHQGRGDLVWQHLDRAVALVRELGPTPSKAEVLVDLANYLSMARDHERTIATAGEALEIAQALGLDELQAMALSAIGISKGLSGDLGGRAELQRAIRITEEIGSHLSTQCYGMLADLEGQLGHLERCFDLQARGRSHAARYGHAGFVRWLEAERVGEHYWRGGWDEAIALADGFIAEAETGAPHFMEGYCRAMRGRIRLARGDADGALEDAARGLRFGRAAEDLQTLYPVLAFAARAEVLAGSREDATPLLDELLACWLANLDAYPASSWVVDLAVAAHGLGRGRDVVSTAGRVTAATRWLGAVVHLLSGRPADAAEEFRVIGSRPDEAVARLRAAEALELAGRPRDAAAQRRRAADFLSAVGADASGEALAVARVRREPVRQLES